MDEMHFCSELLAINGMFGTHAICLAPVEVYLQVLSHSIQEFQRRPSLRFGVYGISI